MARVVPLSCENIGFELAALLRLTVPVPGDLDTSQAPAHYISTVNNSVCLFAPRRFRLDQVFSIDSEPHPPHIAGI